MQDFPSRLQAILDAENLTVYGACMVIGAETDEPTKTIHARLKRWLRKTPKTLREVEIALNSLGYEIKIEKSKPSPRKKNRTFYVLPIHPVFYGDIQQEELDGFISDMKNVFMSLGFYGYGYGINTDCHIELWQEEKDKYYVKGSIDNSVIDSQTGENVTKNQPDWFLSTLNRWFGVDEDYKGFRQWFIDSYLPCAVTTGS